MALSAGCCPRAVASALASSTSNATFGASGSAPAAALKACRAAISGEASASRVRVSWAELARLLCIRAAITRRMPLRGTRRSTGRSGAPAPGTPPAGAAARAGPLPGAVTPPCGGAAGAAATAPTEGTAFAAVSTSASVIRPPGPVPLSQPSSTPSSLARLRAAGEARTAPPDAATPAGPRSVADAARGAGAAAGAAATALVAGSELAAIWTSASVIRPPGPVPLSQPSSTPSSLARLRAAGEARTAPAAGPDPAG